MIRRLVALAFTAGLVLVPSAALAHGEGTCTDVLGIDNHGEHVVGDYVLGTGHDGDWPYTGVGGSIAGEGADKPGGPGPAAHFPDGVAPGASFCNGQSSSPGIHF
ncbi:MAG TPA: hypothetical protein VNT31_13515 [Nocardioides sp.]|nr:hypothetical protein [Nocardioides sp.]